MSAAIIVENIGKQFRLGAAPAKYGMLREVIRERARGVANFVTGGPRWRRESRVREEHSMWALRDVSFEVEQGEVVGVVGRNGSGKSTLLKVLSRITAPTTGVARIRGRVGSLLEVGTGFHPELTGRDNIMLNGAILGLRRHEILRRFSDIVDFSEVAQFIDTAVKHYSSGMYLRLAFAVAAHLETDILLVDEVLSVGDAHFQRKCLQKTAEVAQQGRTVLFVSHNMATVSSLCHSALVLQRGNLVFRGPTAGAIRHYLELGAQGDDDGNLSGAERSGLGGVRILRWGYASQHSESGYLCGAPLELAFYYECVPDFDLRDFRFEVRFRDEFGSSLFTLSNKYVERERTQFGRSGWMTFALDELPLRPGAYPLTIWIESPRGIEDYLDRAVRFEVTNADFFGTGRALEGVSGAAALDTGSLLVRHRFTVQESPRP